MNERQWDITYRDSKQCEAFSYVTTMDYDAFLEWVWADAAEHGADVVVRCDGEFCFPPSPAPVKPAPVEPELFDVLLVLEEVDSAALGRLLAGTGASSPASERIRVRAQASQYYYPVGQE